MKNLLRQSAYLLLILLAMTATQSAENDNEVIADGFYLLHISISDMALNRIVKITRVPNASNSDPQLYRIETPRAWGSYDESALLLEQDHIVVYGKQENHQLTFIIPDTNKMAPYYFTYHIAGSQPHTGHVRYNGPHTGNDNFTFDLLKMEK